MVLEEQRAVASSLRSSQSKLPSHFQLVGMHSPDVQVNWMSRLHDFRVSESRIGNLNIIRWHFKLLIRQSYSPIYQPWHSASASSSPLGQSSCRSHTQREGMQLDEQHENDSQKVSAIYNKLKLIQDTCLLGCNGTRCHRNEFSRTVPGSYHWPEDQYQIVPSFKSKYFMELQNTSVRLLLNLIKMFHGGE